MPYKDFRFGISGSVQGVDLNQLLVSHPAATYFMRIATDSPELGLLEGDVVVVDRSLEPSATDIVVVGIEDESELKFTRFRKVPRVAELWGTVKYIIRKVSG